VQADAPLIRVRPLTPADAERCDAIIASLPGWFGVPEGIEECAHAVRTQRGLVAASADGSVIGFLTVTRPADGVGQITWLAVDAELRGRGVGSALIARLVADLRAERVRLLVVETLSDREDPGPEYAATRAFYLARGFRPAAEMNYFPDNPIQLMSMRLGS
jgi:ribosomal protein S18 acetylase RimI-like enzyme